MSYATKEQLAELAAYMASQINVPTIGIGGGYAPIGTIISYMGTTAPQDYLACDGSTKNIADYPQLADFFEAQFGSKNYFGGDGVTTFAVPDLQGEFLRGTGTNSHTNQGSGANVGEHQDGTEHRDIRSGPKNWGNIFFQNAADTAPGSINQDSTINYLDPTSNGATINKTTQTANYPPTHYTSRPTNTSILWCIKAVVAGDVYSTDERVVGTWIDGKPVYRKVVTINMTLVKQWQEYTISPAITNLDVLINYTCISGGLSVGNNIVAFMSLYIDTNGSKLHTYLDPASGLDGTAADRVFIFDYTKTTD